MSEAKNTTEDISKVKECHRPEDIHSDIACSWLMAASGLIAFSYLFLYFLTPLLPRWIPLLPVIVLIGVGLIFPFAQGKKYPINEDAKSDSRDALKMTIASMLVPLYFLFVLIAQVIAWIKSSVEPRLPLFLTALALGMILFIKKARPQPSKQLKTKRIRIFYASTLSTLGTIAVVIGIDASSSLPKENFIEIFCAIAFLVIVMALALGYLAQEPEFFFSKLVIGEAKFNCKNFAVVMGIALPWFLLWIVTSFLTPYALCCAIISIFVLFVWQTWAVEETSKWIFD